MDIRDFFKGARRRGPNPDRVGDLALVAPSAAGAAREKVNATEENLFSASVGFAFKCGVCGKAHKSSLLEKVQSLKLCIKRVVKRFGGPVQVYRNKRYVKSHGDIEPSYGHGVKFLPEPEVAETIRFSYKTANAFTSIRPTSLAFATMYPKLDARFTEFSNRLNAVLAREFVEEVSVKEALGAPSTIKYIENRQEAFKQRAEAEAERVRLEQEALDPEVYTLAREWHTRKPEKFRVGDIERGHSELKEWFQKRAPNVEPVRRVKINGKTLDSGTIIGWFNTLDAAPVWDAYRTGTAEKVLFDFGVVDGFPAISWGMVGCREFPRKHNRREYKGLTVLNFVTLWGGKTFMNVNGRHGEFSLRTAMQSRSLVEIKAVDEEYLVAKSDLSATENDS